jgi:twitching motility protein PilT
VTTPYASVAFLHQLLGKALAAQASDIHLKVGQPPGARVRGDLVYFRVEKIKPEDTEAVARVLLEIPSGRAPLEGSDARVMAYQVPGIGRFRVSLFRQRGAFSLVMRSIPLEVPTPAALGVPAAVTSLLDGGPGLVVVTGGAAQGKTSTLAALIGKVNEALPRQVITLEDPIEFLHEDRRAGVCQREVGSDVSSFADGLRASLHQDADLVVVDGLGAEGALEAAVEVAESARLVLGSISASDVPVALGRLFAGAGAELRERLVECLRAVVAQRLVLRRDGLGMALATELLVVTPALRSALLRPESHAASRSALLKDAMAQGGALGMSTFEGQLEKLASEGVIAAPARVAEA